MSWGSSQYDDNPFAETSGIAQDRVPLTVSTPTTLVSTEPPPWLQDAPASSQPTPAPPPPQASNPWEEPKQPSTQPVDKAIPNMILYTRIINLVLSGCMIAASVLSLLTTSDITTGVLSCYIVVFACLLCCFETHLKQVSKIIALNFGFLYSAKSRCIFLVFIGIILFDFSLFSKIIGAFMLANAGFNAYIIVRYPEYEDYQRKDAQSEIQDFLSANPAFAKQIIAAGTDLAVKNPDVVKQGASAYFKSASGPQSANV